MTILRRLSRLSAGDLSVLAQSLVLLVLVRIALLLLPFGAVQKHCSRALQGVSRSSARHHVTPQRVVRLVHLMGRVVPGAHCLPRALVAQLLLRRRGFDSDLRIGVRKDDTRLDAHAWLELDGTPLLENDETLKDYTPFQASFVSTPKAE